MALTTIDPVSALVVIDLQRGIVSAHGDTAVVKQAAHLATEFRRHGLPVVLVNVTGRAPGRTDAGWPGGGALPDGWADLVDELDVRPADHLITKRRRSAFHDTGVERVFPKLGETATAAEVVARVETTR
jgi:nicotinamidase-related amidase